MDARSCQPKDIVWIKNISNTRDNQAYLTSAESDEFVLALPKGTGKNARSPKKGELILLFQKIDKEDYFTHLVTPLDDEPEDIDNQPRHPRGRRVKVLAITLGNHKAIRRKDTNWANVKFNGVSQGYFCKIGKIASLKSDYEYISILQHEIWDKIGAYSRPGVRIWDNDPEISQAETLVDNEFPDQPNFSASEGGRALVTHFIHERNRGLVSEKKAWAMKNNLFYCEVCHFSFLNHFQQAFIECHHLTPIAKGGERKTTIEDLALVCANCHRMLHRMFDGEYLSIAQMRNRYFAS
jgi:5-methylcytosine-specific restriction enzyme A